MLENSRFGQLGDPAGIDFVQKIVSSIMLPLETATDAKTPSQHPKTRISTNCDDFFSENKLK